MKKALTLLLAAVLALVLLALPVAARLIYFYEGRFATRNIPRPDLAAVSAPTPPISAFDDRLPTAVEGTVLVDMAHRNNLQVSELNVLKSRLESRGQRVEWVESSDDLAGSLRYAKALVVISPREDWKAGEIRSVREFVDKGGRLLLVADATRYEFVYDESGNFLGLDHDATHINGLAGQFGVIFQSDYLYNTSEYESNFRNIKLSRFGASPLTDGLHQTVVYGARSILSQEPPLIQAAGATRSSNSGRVQDLAVAVLAGAGQVLAVGDLTFMTEPYDAVADNDRFVANVADFLSGAQRRYGLSEFPSFFRNRVDLVFVSDPLLNSDLLSGGGKLQILFDQQGKSLTVQRREDTAQDTLFLGLYDQAKALEPYLQGAQVTLPITLTREAGSNQDAGEPRAAITATGQISAGAESHLEIQSFGQMVVTGTALLMLESQGQRQVLVVLAHTQAGIEDALQRLTDGDLADCLLRATETPSHTVVALCPTGEVKPGSGAGGWTEPEAGTVPPADTGGPPPSSETSPGPAGAKGNVLIVSLDTATGRYDSLTGADEFAAILESGYKVTVWSKKKDGLPDLDTIAASDLVILASGDFADAYGQEESALLMQIMLGGTPVILSGAYLGESGTESVLRDIQVKQADHPIAKGFEADQVIALADAPSGSEYEVQLLGSEADAAAVPFVRGPASEDAGAAALLVMEETGTGMRAVFMGLPVYLLPKEARARLVNNAVDWLLAPGEG